MRKGKHMEMDTFFNGYRMIPGGKSDLEVMETDYQKYIDELKFQIENLEEENTSLKEKLEEQEALVTALDDIQHWLNIIRDVFYDLNKKDIYRNNF